LLDESKFIFEQFQDRSIIFGHNGSHLTRVFSVVYAEKGVGVNGRRQLFE
jgi:hypothetical protein